MKRNNQQGFTLIELIMVIVILGILAATALPKFVNMSGDARAAALQGAYGAINSAINIAYSEALIKSATGSTGSISMNGTTVSLVYGYPDLTGIIAAVTLAGGTLTWGTATSTSIPLNISGATTASTCVITYTQATATVPASASINVAGC